MTAVPDTIDWPADNRPSERWPIYTRGNVGEVYPEVVLPLEWAIGGPVAEAAWREAGEHIGFFRPDDYGPDDYVVIGVFGGYAYFNVSLMRLLGVRTPGLAPEVIDTQFLGDADIAPYTEQPGDRNAASTAKMVLTAVKTLTARRVPRVDAMRRTADRARSQAPELEAPTDSLWRFSRHTFTRAYRRLLADHVIVTMQATIAAGALTDLCEKHLDDPDLAVALMAGVGDVVSAEPAHEMWRLANETSPGDFEQRFARFLDAHGHRGPNEFSLLGKDWATYPDIARAAIDALRGIDDDRSPDAVGAASRRTQQELLRSTRERLGWRRVHLDRVLATAALWSRAREASKSEVIRAAQPARRCYLELVRRAAAEGGVPDPEGPMLLTEAEFTDYLRSPTDALDTIESRRGELAHLRSLSPPFAFDAQAHGGRIPPLSTWERRERETDPSGPGTVLEGTPGAPGTARGRARILLDPTDPSRLSPGEVLVAPLTDPSWTPLFVPCAAVVVEVGAAMSHSMIISRELGIPCAVGVDQATSRIADGSTVEVDGSTGAVRIIDVPSR